MSRPEKTTVVLTVLLCTVVLVTGRFVVEKGSIKVLRPVNLRGRHDGSIANFGVPRYGAYLTGVVMYPDQHATGCQAFEGRPFRRRSKRPVILLLDRGDCLFALKAWNAQKAGAGAVLVVDNIQEHLITMDTPEESRSDQDYVANITIPSVLIDREFGESLKLALRRSDSSSSDAVVARLDWRESMPHPDERVEYELWTNSNDECGLRCEEQMGFVREFRGHAHLLERGGYVAFTPHYITWFCSASALRSEQCRSQCIYRGRYCAPDPEGDFGEGYEGRDVVLENLRQLCVHRAGKEENRSWVWWDFVTDFHIRCSMKKRQYSKECAEDVLISLDLPVEKIKKCMGDPNADVDNEVLKAEQELQVGSGSRGDVTILPTLVINNVQYRGVLRRTAVLKAICAGFRETTEPSVCLSGDIETNQCIEKNGGCWQDTRLNITACKDTFRGRICQCPTLNGVEYHGDGYKSCKAVGPARCTLDNAGCWSEIREGQKFSACSESELSGCRCPSGFLGDGYKCEDVNECMEESACQCEGCSCRNTWGGYDCKCKGNLLYIKEEDTCIARNTPKIGWLLTVLLLSCVAGAGIACYLFYKYRLRSYMDAEIMAIMSQYMPLDTHQESQPLRQASTL